MALVWGHVLISLASILISEAVITGGGILGCKPCVIDDCKNETNCPLGFVMDVCNCCTKCLRVNGKFCLELWYDTLENVFSIGIPNASKSMTECKSTVAN